MKIREKLNLRKNLPTLLVLGGGFGVGPILEVMESINKIKQPMQTIVVAGRNEALKRKLETNRFRHPTKVFGFVTNMNELMMSADLILSKPGGLTSSEALSLGKPLLIFNPIPGQEMANSDFLLENGTASKLNHIDDLPYKVSLIMTPKRLLKMSGNAKRLGRPKASVHICDIVSNHLR